MLKAPFSHNKLLFFFWFNGSYLQLLGHIADVKPSKRVREEQLYQFPEKKGWKVKRDLKEYRIAPVKSFNNPLKYIFMSNYDQPVNLKNSFRI